MSESFNDPSRDSRDKLTSELYEKMLDSDIFDAVELINYYQTFFDYPKSQNDSPEEYADESVAYPPAEDLEEAAIQKIYEEVGKCGIDIFDEEMIISAKIRPFESGYTGGLENLLEENTTAEIIDTDERGVFMYCMDMSGFSITGFDTVPTNEGDKLCIVVGRYDDEYGDDEKEFGIIPDEIVKITREEQDDGMFLEEFTKLHPEINEQLQTLKQNEPNMRFIQTLAGLNIVLPEHKLHENDAILERKLGRLATIIANLDDAPHTITFKKDYTVMDSSGQYEPNYIEEEASVIADVNAIEYEARKDEDGDFVFRPELLISVGLPGKLKAYASLRIPPHNITSFASTRSNNEILFQNGDDVKEMDRSYRTSNDIFPHDDDVMMYSTETEEYSEEDAVSFEQEDSIEERFLQYRQLLEAAWDNMEEFIQKMQLLQDQHCETFEEVGVLLEQNPIEFLTASSIYWNYVGDGVITSGNVDENGKIVPLSTVTGTFSTVMMVGEPYTHEDGEEGSAVSFYLMLREQDATETAVAVQSYELEGGVSLPIELEQKTKQRAHYIRVDSIEDIPTPVNLEDIERREEIVDKAKDTFGEDSELATLVEEFATIFNHNLVNSYDEYLDVPVKRIKHALSQQPDAAKDFVRMMAECPSVKFGSAAMMSGEVKSFPKGAQKFRKVPYEGNVELLGIQEGGDLEFSDDPFIFLARVNGQYVNIPLSGLRNLSIGGMVTTSNS